MAWRAAPSSFYNEASHYVSAMVTTSMLELITRNDSHSCVRAYDIDSVLKEQKSRKFLFFSRIMCEVHVLAFFGQHWYISHSFSVCWKERMKRETTKCLYFQHYTTSSPGTLIVILVVHFRIILTYDSFPFNLIV